MATLNVKSTVLISFLPYIIRKVIPYLFYLFFVFFTVKQVCYKEFLMFYILQNTKANM